MLDVQIMLDGDKFEGQGIDTSVMAAGEHTLVITVTDASGNTASDSVVFVIETAEEISDSDNEAERIINFYRKLFKLFAFLCPF